MSTANRKGAHETKWTNKTMDPKVTMASNVGNVLLGLREDTDLSDAIAFDEMARTPVLARALSGRIQASSSGQSSMPT